ncbi:hypothetical protein GCM10009827_056890 [Dactylosporangium maewongense]|uniref:Secreted protein n=1 Tax=Dactylosporangium maewongense TaxID=634393 RepID=A0ABN2B2W3_9ACTN
MSRKLRSWCVSLAAAGALLAAPVPAFAGGVVDPAPIAPNNPFVGLVNDQTPNATIRMACFGPVHIGQTGHPMDGQTVKVLPVTGPTTSQAGYTGSAANSVLVSFGPASSTTSPIVLRTWAVSAKIPTTLVLPCYGTGTVTFAPYPTSATARSATVQVTFVGQP